MKTSLFCIFLFVNALSTFGQGYDTVAIHKEFGGIEIAKNGKHGMILKDTTFGCEYDIVSFIPVSKKLILKKEGKWGLYLGKNQGFIPLEYNMLQPIYATYFDDQNHTYPEVRYYWLRKEEKEFLFDISGKKIMDLPAQMYCADANKNLVNTLVALPNEKDALIKVPILPEPDEAVEYSFYRFSTRQTKTLNFLHALSLHNSTLFLSPYYFEDETVVFYNAFGDKIGMTKDKYLAYDDGFPINYYYNGKLKVRNNDGWGMIDSLGKELIPCRYLSLLWMDGKHIWAFAYDNQVHIYNDKGEKLKELYAGNFQVNDANAVYYYLNPEQPYYLMNNAFIPMDGRKLDERNRRNLYANLIVVQNDAGYYGVVDVTGKEVVVGDYDKIQVFGNQRIVANIDIRHSFFDAKGKVLIDSVAADAVEQVNSNCYMLQKNNDTFWLIDSMGKQNLPHTYRTLLKSWLPSGDDFMFGISKEDLKRVLINTKTNKHYPVAAEVLPEKLLLLQDGVIWLCNAQTMFLLDTEGKLLKTMPNVFGANPQVQQTNDPKQPLEFTFIQRQLYLNRKDSIVLQADAIRPFSGSDAETDFFWVRKDNRWAFFDSNVQQVTPYEYDDAGLLVRNNTILIGYWAQKGKNYYFINTTNGKVVWSGEMTYYDQYDIYALVKTADGKSYLIDRNANTYQELKKSAEFSAHYALPDSLYKPDVNAVAGGFWMVMGDSIWLLSKEKGRYGIVNNKGHRILDALYDTLVLSSSYTDINLWGRVGDKVYLYHRDSMHEVPSRQSYLYDPVTYEEIPYLEPAGWFMGNWLVVEEVNQRTYTYSYKLTNRKTGATITAESVEYYVDNELLLYTNKKWRLLGEDDWISKPHKTLESLSSEKPRWEEEVEPAIVVENPKKLKKYEHYYEADNGWIVYKKGAFGWVNANNYKLRIPLLYSHLEQIQGDTFLAKVGKQTMIINSYHEGIYLFKEDWAVWNMEGTPFYGYNLKSEPLEKGLLDRNFQPFLQPKYKNIEAISDWSDSLLLRVEWADSIGVLDLSGKLLVAMPYDSEDWYILDKLQQLYENPNLDISIFEPREPVLNDQYLKKNLGKDWYIFLSTEVYETTNANDFYFNYQQMPYSEENALSYNFLVFDKRSPVYYSAKGDRL